MYKILRYIARSKINNKRGSKSILNSITTLLLLDRETYILQFESMVIRDEDQLAEIYLHCNWTIYGTKNNALISTTHLTAQYTCKAVRRPQAERG